MKHACLALIAMALFLPMTAGGPAAAADSPDTGTVKKGILLVTFGTTFPEARSAYENLAEEARRAFPEIPVHWAYTSQIIREKMAESGKQVHSPAHALKEMEEKGFTHVAVQSLHTIPGQEYHDLVRTVGRLKQKPGGIKDIRIGKPLLAGPHDMKAAAQAILETLPEKRKPEQAVILMGHGTHHPANAAYAALMWRVRLSDPNVYIGTVEGFPGAEKILSRLQDSQTDAAWLMPFMSVAGDHARNDLAGGQDEAWKSIFTRAGIRCRPVLKGTAEYDAFADIWIRHLGEAMEKL